MPIACAFRNGIGNAVIFTSILQAINYHNQGPVDVILNDVWQGESKNAVVSIFKSFDFVNIVHYNDSFDFGKYERIYLSTHSVFDDLYAVLHNVEELDKSKHAFWSYDFLSEIDFYYLELMREIGYKGKRFPQYMSYDSSLNIKGKGIKIAIANGYQRGSSNIFKRKQYPHFPKVMESIRKFYGDVTFFLLGGIEDQEWAEELTEYGECKNYTGALNILETASVIKQCDLIIANDSSSYHIADALGTPGVVLMASTLCSKNGPLNGNIIPVRSPLSCAPCQRTFLWGMCDEDNKCMESISPSYVMAAVRRILDGS